jgi:hypothetical protein
MEKTTNVKASKVGHSRLGCGAGFIPDLFDLVLRNRGIRSNSGDDGSNKRVTMSGDKTLTGVPAVLLLVATAMFWIFPEWLLSATPGKLACRLRVVSQDGSAISFSQACKRNLVLTAGRKRLAQAERGVSVERHPDRQPNRQRNPFRQCEMPGECWHEFHQHEQQRHRSPKAGDHA